MTDSAKVGLRREKGSQKFHAKVLHMERENVIVLVDSGASVSILGRETVKSWPYYARSDIHPVQTSLITVTGESTPFDGKTEVEICLGRQKINHEFLIADIKYGGILGLDFLMQNNCK